MTFDTFSSKSKPNTCCVDFTFLESRQKTAEMQAFISSANYRRVKAAMNMLKHSLMNRYVAS